MKEKRTKIMFFLFCLLRTSNHILINKNVVLIHLEYFHKPRLLFKIKKCLEIEEKRRKRSLAGTGFEPTLKIAKL